MCVFKKNTQTYYDCKCEYILYGNAVAIAIVAGYRLCFLPFRHTQIENVAIHICIMQHIELNALYVYSYTNKYARESCTHFASRTTIHPPPPLSDQPHNTSVRFASLVAKTIRYMLELGRGEECMEYWFVHFVSKRCVRMCVCVCVWMYMNAVEMSNAWNLMQTNWLGHSLM